MELMYRYVNFTHFNDSYLSKSAVLKMLVVIFSCVISVVNFGGFYYQYNYPKWVVFDSFCILLVIYAIRSLPSIKLNVIGFAIGFLALYMLITLAWAPNIFESALFICRFLAFTLSIYILISSFSKEKLLSVMTDSVFYASIVFSAATIYERYWLGNAYSSSNFSPIGFVNYLGHVLNIWIPILVLSIYNKRKSLPHLLLGLISLAFLMHLLVESNTRGTILGLLFAEIIVICVILLKTKKVPIKYFSISAAFLGAVVSYSAIDELGFSKLETQLKLIQSLDTGRDKLFLNTIDMIKDNPYGVGVNNFEYIHQKYAKAGTEESSPYITELSILRTPYNILLKFYSELGFIGGSLFLVIFGLVFIQALHNLLKGDYIDAWIFMAVFSLYFHSMFSSVFLTPVSLFFSILLFSFLLSRRGFFIKSAVSFRIEPVFLCLPLVIFLGYLSTLKTVSGNLTSTGYRIGDTDKVQSALDMNPHDYFAALRLFDLYLIKERNAEQALKSLEHAIKLYPYNLYMLIRAAEASAQLGLNNKAEMYKARALAINPNNTQALSVNTGGKLRE
ncbi:O-antigen ligase family protein [Pseudoalteromonas luteoviolacea]|nr:O-antigen ligase family protein [Pseudoalteromonas luteoviolacea]